MDEPRRTILIRRCQTADALTGRHRVVDDLQAKGRAGLAARTLNKFTGKLIGKGQSPCHAPRLEDGVFDITRITGEVPDDVPTSGNDHYYLVPGRQYRLVFIGQGTRLEGRLYELPDTIHPLRTIVGFDSIWASGVSGLIVYDNSDLADNLTDATFDNFVSHDTESPRLEISGPDTFGEITLSMPVLSSNGRPRLPRRTWTPSRTNSSSSTPPAPKPRPTIRWSRGWGKSSTACAVRKKAWCSRMSREDAHPVEAKGKVRRAKVRERQGTSGAGQCFQIDPALEVRGSLHAIRPLRFPVELQPRSTRRQFFEGCQFHHRC